MSNKYIVIHSLVLCLLIAKSSHSTHFSSEANQTANLGSAYAGLGSEAVDASTAYYNPAGLSWLGREQVSFSAMLVDSSKLFIPSITESFSGSKVSGTKNSTTYNLDFIPAAYYARRLGDDFIFGLNLVRPTEIKNRYSAYIDQRHVKARSELRAISFGPSLAYKMCDAYSVGAGIDIVSFRSKLATSDMPNEFADTLIRKDKDRTWGVGYHLGFLYHYANNRVGMHYRSKAKGKANLVSQVVGGVNVNQKIKHSVELPESLRLSLFYVPKDRWALMADLTWTHWSTFKPLKLHFEDGFSRKVSHSFKDTYGVSSGVNYIFNDDWRLRFGVAFDQAPMKEHYQHISKGSRNIYWLAAGVQYRFSRSLTANIGYARGFSQVIFTNKYTMENLARSRGVKQLLGVQVSWDLR